MGTPCAGDYANVFYGTYERTTLLPNFAHLIPLLCRFIDDSVGIWADPDLPSNLTDQQEETWFQQSDKWKKYVAALPFGGLQWTTCGQTDTQIGTPRRSVDFMDVTITIEPSGNIAFRTFQKPMNLFLYLPPASDHPDKCLRGLVIGTMIRYYEQNTYPADFVHFASKFITDITTRGHPIKTIKPFLTAAATRIHERSLTTFEERRAIKYAAQEKLKDTLFLHWDFCSSGIPSSLVRKMFNACGLNKSSGFNDLIISQHRPLTYGTY